MEFLLGPRLPAHTDASNGHLLATLRLSKCMSTSGNIDLSEDQQEKINNCV